MGCHYGSLSFDVFMSKISDMDRADFYGACSDVMPS